MNPLTCDLCPRFEEKFKSKADDNATLNQKSGDWKYDEKSPKHSLESIIRETASSEWRWRNPYSVSDFDRTKWRCQHDYAAGKDDFASNFLRELCNKDGHHKDLFKDDGKRGLLYNFREYLVNYQESCGIPRTEYSFLSLLNTMGRLTGRSLLALLCVMLNIVPVVEVFLYLLRFVLDKVISIKNSKDFRQTATRCLIFTTELFSLYVCLIFIFGFIILPVVHMIVDIVAKIMLYS